MPVEPDFDYVDQLNELNPTSGPTGDPASEGAIHLRGIKSALQGNVAGTAAGTQLLVGNVKRWFVEAFSAQLRTDQTTPTDAQLGVLGSIGAALYTTATGTVVGGVRLLSDAGALGAWLVRGTADAAVSVFATNNVLGFVSGSDGLGVERDGEEPELVATDADAAVQLRGLGIQDLGYGSAGTVRDVSGGAGSTRRPVGFNSLPPLATTTNRTLLPEDCGKRVRCDGAGPLAIDTGALAALNEGWTVVVTNRADDPVTITHPGGIELYGGNGLVTAGSVTLDPAGVCTLTVGPGDVLEIYGVKVSA